MSDRIYEILLQACLPDLRTGKNQVSPQKLLQFNRKNLGGKMIENGRWKIINGILCWKKKINKITYIIKVFQVSHRIAQVYTSRHVA